MHSKIDLQVIFTNGLSNKHPIDHTAVDFEKAISLTGFGKFHYLIVLMSGVIFASAGFQNGLNAYIMPSAQCDLQMTSNEKGLLNALFLAGGIASAFFWGAMADHVGRKKVLAYSLILDGTITFVSSFSQTFSLFVFFRFLNGFLIGAPGSIVFTYLGEFLADKQRASSLCAVGFFWTISWMILPAVALAVMPITWAYEAPGFLFNSWRMYVAMFAFPSLISGLILAAVFPESPKFLFSQGREMETLEVLQRMYQGTYGKEKGEYPVKAIIPDESDGNGPSIILNSAEDSSLSKESTGKTLCHILKGIWTQAKSLFSYPLISTTGLASTLMFTNMFGYYGLGLWLPELFNRFEDHYRTSNVSVTVCEMTTFKSNVSLLNMLNETMIDPFITSDGLDDSCSSNDVNEGVFINTFIIGASCLIGNVLSAILAKKVGLKTLTILTMLISGVSSTAIYFLKTATQNLLISCVFLTFVGTANTVISSAIVDLFPTKVRALAVCTAIFAGRMGAVASNLTLGYILDISCEVPIFLMGSVLICGSFLGFLLPSGSKKTDLRVPKINT